METPLIVAPFLEVQENPTLQGDNRVTPSKLGANFPTTQRGDLPRPKLPKWGIR